MLRRANTSRYTKDRCTVRLVQIAGAERAREDNAPKVDEPTGLFRLPRKLQDPIYHFALVEPKMDTMEHDVLPPPQPALLQVCRQIRSETTKLYYFSNFLQPVRLLFQIIDCDASKYSSWCQSSPLRKDSWLPTWSFAGDKRDWSNMLIWLEAYCRKVCRGPEAISRSVPAIMKRVELELFKRIASTAPRTSPFMGGGQGAFGLRAFGHGNLGFQMGMMGVVARVEPRKVFIADINVLVKRSR